MANTENLDEIVRVPTRIDARRNYDKLIAAAREAFGEEGTAVSLESIAKRAGVGIGTLYRHFPSREDLFKAVYVQNVRDFCDTVAEYDNLEPWDALAGWLREFMDFVVTKRALAQELMRSFGHKQGQGMFSECRLSIYDTGEPLLKQAQDAGLVRKDVDFDEAMKLLSGMALVQFADDEQRERVVNIALDGLRAH